MVEVEKNEKEDHIARWKEGREGGRKEGRKTWKKEKREE
jgi:hypothetical protein